MEDKSFVKQYKIIPLYSKAVEEYEVNHDNIGELTVMLGTNDISKQSKVIFNFSKEALIGFAHELIRLDDSLPENFHLHVDPIGTSIANQTLGFFLTPESPDFIIYRKNFGKLSDYGIDKLNNNYKGRNDYNTLKLDYLVDLEFNHDFIECYNLGFSNVAEIKVLLEDKDVTRKCTVILKLSKSALLGLGTQLIRLANNIKEKNNYLVKPIGSEGVNCRLGFFLTPESASLIIGNKPINSVFFYDKDYGKT